MDETLKQAIPLLEKLDGWAANVVVLAVSLAILVKWIAPVIAKFHRRQVKLVHQNKLAMARMAVKLEKARNKNKMKIARMAVQPLKIVTESGNEERVR